jgi:DNA-directed RNA polymerase specialized sigma24 family protein
MFENTSPFQTSHEDGTVRRPLPDGGTAEETLYLRYGDSADAVGEPDKVFARIGDDTYALVPETALGWSIVEQNEVEPGVVNLGPLEGEPLGMLRKELDYVELDELAEAINEGTDFSTEESTVLLLYEGFEMEPSEIAATTDLSEEAVQSRLQDIYDEYSIDRLVDTVCEHTDLSRDDARAFVLADGFGLSSEEVAAELDISTDTAEERLDRIRTEYDDIDVADLLFGQN